MIGRDIALFILHDRLITPLTTDLELTPIDGSRSQVKFDQPFLTSQIISHDGIVLLLGRFTKWF